MNTVLNHNNIAEGSITPRGRGGIPKGQPSFPSGLIVQAGVAFCLIAGLLLFYGKYYPIHQDLAGSALSGRLALVLGDSFSDYSVYFPPVEKIWFSLAAQLSDLTGLRLDLVVVAMTGVAILFGGGLAYQIRRASVGASPLFFVASVAVLTILPILFKNIFGLREHMVVLGLWPYLVLRISDPESRLIGWRLRAILGLWMGATLLFKYLYSVVVLLVESTDAYLQRQPLALFRLENILAGAVVFLYLFLWLGIDPDQRAAISAMLSAIDAALIDPSENGIKAAQNIALAIILLILSRTTSAPVQPTAIIFGATCGAVIAAWAQERWFSHHLFPIMMAYAMWLWIGLKQFRWWVSAALGLYLCATVYGEFQATRDYHQRLSALEQALNDRGLSVAGKKVALLNAHPSPYNEYLVSHGGLRWTPLMNNAYVAAELEPYDRKANVGKTLPPVKLEEPGRKMLHSQMLQLWDDIPPDIIIVDRTSRWPLRHIAIDWTQAFSNDPRFKVILTKYRSVQAYNGAAIRFTYYVRAD